MKVLLFAETGKFHRIFSKAVILLREKGISVVFASIRDEGELHQQFRSLGIPTYSLGAKSSLDYPGAVIRLARFIRNEDFDIIHSGEAIAAALGGLAGILARKGSRIYGRQHIMPEDSASREQALFSRIGSKTNQFIMACSKATAEAAEIYDNVPKERLLVAYNGTDVLRSVESSEIEKLRDSLEIAEGSKVIGIVAQLRAVKGHSTLFEALPSVAASTKGQLHLLVIGSGPDEERLRNEAAALENIRVHFVGYQEDVALWFSSADVIAMPSHHEALPWAALEAMYCKKPLVASRVGGFCEIIDDGVNGLLVEPRDPDDLARALIAILNDGGRASLLGENARTKVIAQFSIDSMVDAWIRCYEYSLSKKE